MNKALIHKDYGQDSFTSAQIKAFRKQDDQKRKAKKKEKAKLTRIPTR